MKILRLIIFTAAVCGFISCQKELNFNAGDASAGTLVKDAGGNCLPVTVNGLFKVDSALSNSNYVDVQVNVSTPGTFNIKSDTVNGYSFSKTGNVVAGTNTIRLYASGKPVAASTNTFTIKYGTSSCSFDITVVASGGGGSAVFTLGGSPGACTGASTSGPFIAGVPLTTANTLTIQVNVISTGTYAINAASTGGFIFSASGSFTATGLQNVTLNGSGTPAAAGNAIIIITNVASACTFAVTVLPGAGGGIVSSPYYFSFTEGTKNVTADTLAVAAVISPVTGAGDTAMIIAASTKNGDTICSVTVSRLGIPEVGVTYRTSSIGASYVAAFRIYGTSSGSVYYNADPSTILQSIDIKFDVVDRVNKIVSGTFSGTAQNASGTAVTITNGKFRAKLL